MNSILNLAAEQIDSAAVSQRTAEQVLDNLDRRPLDVVKQRETRAFAHEMLERASQRGWDDAARAWSMTRYALDRLVLRHELSALERLTLAHMNIVGDPMWNTVLNGLGLQRKVARLFREHPELPKPANRAHDGTFLYDADPTCTHWRTKARLGGGVQCASCTGWFCF